MADSSIVRRVNKGSNRGPKGREAGVLREGQGPPSHQLRGPGSAIAGWARPSEIFVYFIPTPYCCYFPILLFFLIQSGYFCYRANLLSHALNISKSAKHVLLSYINRLIINDDVDKGSQMPHIERALANGYEVLVLSTNVNVWPDVRPNSAVPVQHVPVYRQLQLQCTLYTTDFWPTVRSGLCHRKSVCLSVRPSVCL